MSQDVLVVDDSATMRQVVTRIIRLTGLNVGSVYEASNGIEALACLADHEVAALLLDINMPVMNGLQLLTRMKQNERLKLVPIVVTSTEGGRERIEELVRLGISGYVRKPFKPEQLRDVLEPLLGVKHGSTVDVDDAVHGSF